jgi:hypothetical protein
MVKYNAPDLIDQGRVARGVLDSASADSMHALPSPISGDTLYVAILYDPPIIHTEHKNDSTLAGLADHLA